MITTASSSALGVILLVCGLLEGCHSLPSFYGPPGFASANAPDAKTLKASGPIPTVSDVISHVQCEIWMLRKAGADAKFADLWKMQYAVYVVLILEVTDDGNLSPSLSFINPLDSARSRQLDIGPQYRNGGHRLITQTFVLDLDPDGNPDFSPIRGKNSLESAFDKYCDDNAQRDGGIRGDLGIADIVAQGLLHARSQAFMFPLAEDDQISTTPIGPTSTVPGFGTTIDFTLTYGLSAGPNWTLSHFVGPGLSSSLANYVRTSKETLILSFAAAQERKPKRPVASPRTREDDDQNLQAARRWAQGNSRAINAATNNAAFSILQRILPNSR